MTRKPRSHCPIAYALDLFGDRWTLLVVRDLGLKGKRSFGELLASEEKIARNILSDRLQKLQTDGFVSKTEDPSDARRITYRLTELGRSLLPTLVEIIVWSARHDPKSAADADFVRKAKRDRAGLIRELDKHAR